MKKIKNAFLSLIGVLLVSSCSSNKIDYYKDKKPTMDFKSFFNGKLVARGVYFNLKEQAESRFIMNSEGILKGNKMTLNQDITYLDRNNEKKHFNAYAMFNDQYPNSFIYKDEMMVGEGVYEQQGNATHVSYDLKIEREDKSTIIVHCDDWLYLIDEKHAINKIKITKFGIHVGDIIMSIEKIS
jgi:hypothetical protein